MKYVKKKDKLDPKVLVVALCFAVVLGLLFWLVLGSRDDPGGDPIDPSGQTQTDPQQTGEGIVDPDETTEPAVLELPYSLENGKLSVDTVLQFTGLNPDRQDEWAEDVAAIMLTNNSQLHMASANITVVTSGGTAATFTAYDIPPGMSAMVVSPENTHIESNPGCIQIFCDAEFLPQLPLADDRLLISVVGTDITVENISGEDLSQITIYCHSMLDTTCYGGTTFVYKIDSLPSGDSTVVSALDHYLGPVEVVRVEIGSE